MLLNPKVLKFICMTQMIKFIMSLFGYKKNNLFENLEEYEKRRK